MRFRDKLLVLGTALVLVPTVAVVALYSLLMSSTLSASASELVRTKLDLLHNRIATSYDVLRRANIASNDFYVLTARQAIGESFSAVLKSGESFFIIDDAAYILESSTPAKGAVLQADDPLRALLDRGRVSTEVTEGAASIRSPTLPSGGKISIVAWKRFEPWSWTLVVASDQALALAPLNRALGLSLALSFILLGIAGIALFFLSTSLSEPLARLSELSKALGEGKRGLSMEVSGRDEIGLLAQQFNVMAKKLDALTEALESRVEARTEELIASNNRLHEVNADLAATLTRVESMRGQLVESEKLVALGQLVAGIAHELNTPLGAISMAAESLKDILVALPAHIDRLAELPSGDRISLFSLVLRPEEGLDHPSRADRVKRQAELAAELEMRGDPDGKETATLLIESGWRGEPLPASLWGEETRDIAWSLYEVSGLGRSASLIGMASSQAVRVIEALRTYARQDKIPERSPVDLAENLEQVLTLFASKIKLGIAVTRHYPSLPPVMASAEKLAQVWTNLIANALQAMHYKGRLGVSVTREGDFAVVEISDSGPGIPEEIRASIFTPFFTTKPPGEGTGLGLEISRRIAEDYGGSIEFDSRPGLTNFRVRLPFAQAPDS